LRRTCFLCVCVCVCEQDLARYKRHVVEAVASLPVPEGPVLLEDKVNALVVEDRTPHLRHVEVRHAMLFSVRVHSKCVCVCVFSLRL
jgi:hypothetical protein